jgi:hypothetical protein
MILHILCYSLLDDMTSDALYNTTRNGMTPRKIRKKLELRLLIET